MSSEAKIGPKVVLYLAIATQFVAASLSFLILFALPIPLFIQLKNGTFHQSLTQSRRRGQEPPYSTYNLYLVYLALVDLSYLLPTIAAEFCTLTPNVCNPRLWSVHVTFAHPPPSNSFVGMSMGDILAYPYGVGNVWINAIISYEVWLLLKATHRRQRFSQPSLTRVNLQCGGVVFGAMALGVFNYYMISYVQSWIYLGVASLLAFAPLFYAIGLTIFVKCRGYMPSVNGSTTPRDRAVRGLALYFFRVVIVFVSIFIPAGMLAILASQFSAEFPELVDYLGEVNLILLSFQSILTFCMIWGKDDVKEYIKDFLALSYLRGSCTCCKRDDTKDVAEDPEMADGQSRRTKTVTILGYNVEDDGGTDDMMLDQFSTASNDDAEEEETDNVVSIVEGEDDNDDRTMADGKTGGNYKYESRRIRRKGPAARVLATGEACPISVRQEDQAEKP